MSESMPGWGEFQSALAQLTAANTGGARQGGAAGIGENASHPVTGTGATFWIDPVDEAYQKPGLEKAGYEVAPSGTVTPTGTFDAPGWIDPVDEAYLAPGLERAGFDITDSGYVSIDASKLSPGAVSGLIARGWAGDPHDRQERLYGPPPMKDIAGGGAARLPTDWVDPVDEAYMIPDIQRRGGSVSSGGDITWRTPAQ